MAGAWKWWTWVCSLTLVLTGCAGVRQVALPQAIPIPPPGFGAPPPSPPTPLERGLASWYGRDHQGKRTANGERFDRRTLTAAHKTLPFETPVAVRNLENGREATVRINDRGPYVEGRVIDLSEAAAEQLDMKNRGVVPVELRVAP